MCARSLSSARTSRTRPRSLVKVVDRRTGQIETQFYRLRAQLQGRRAACHGRHGWRRRRRNHHRPGRGRAPEIRVFTPGRNRADAVPHDGLRHELHRRRGSGRGRCQWRRQERHRHRSDIRPHRSPRLLQQLQSGNPLADPIRERAEQAVRCVLEEVPGRRRRDSGRRRHVLERHNGERTDRPMASPRSSSATALACVRRSTSTT